MAISIRPITLATGTNNPSKQVSKNVWNQGHQLTAAPDVLIGTDGSGDGAEFAMGTGPGEIPTSDHLAANGGSDLIGFIQNGAGAVPRTSQDKMREAVSVSDFATHAQADASGRYLLVAEDVTSSLANNAAVTSLHHGPGQVTTADGNKLAKWFVNVTAPPASTGNADDISTAFNGDLSSHFVVGHRITGTDTLGTPSSGYYYQNEVMPFYGVLHNESGHNEELDGNDGRTGVAFFRVNVKHYGQGDAACYNGAAFVASQKPGATHFLAQPAATLFNGDIQAGDDYVYLNPRELIAHDAGYDVACVGDVVNLNRTNNTGGQECWWSAYRVQSIGSVAINSVFSFVGKGNVGIDFSLPLTDFSPNLAAISLKANQRIYFNNYSTNDFFTDGFNGDWIEYSSGISGMNFVLGGNSVMQLYSIYTNLVAPPKLPVTTCANLMGAAAWNAGMEYYVTDANSSVRGAAAVGGGANFVKVYSNGATWLIA